MANGDDKITIKLKRPVADFSNRLGINGFYPLPDSAFDKQGKIKKEFGQKPVGNGPYTLTTWEPSSQILLDKSTTYRGPREAKNAGLEVKIYADLSAAYQDLLARMANCLILKRIWGTDGSARCKPGCRP